MPIQQPLSPKSQQLIMAAVEQTTEVGALDSLLTKPFSKDVTHNSVRISILVSQK